MLSPVRNKKEYLKRSVSVFNDIIAYGQQVDGVKADRNVVWLSDWFLNNLNYGYKGTAHIGVKIYVKAFQLCPY